MSGNEWTHDWDRDVNSPRAVAIDADGDVTNVLLKCNVNTGWIMRRRLVTDRDSVLAAVIEKRPAPLKLVFNE